MAQSWYVLIDGSIQGPLDSRGLRSLAERGQLQPLDQIRLGTDGSWNLAGDVTGLFSTSEAKSLSSQTKTSESAPNRHIKARLASPYEYKMVQMAPNLKVQEGTSLRGQAASYLEDVVNEHAEDGWEFFRVDQVGLRINPGCLGWFMGSRERTIVYYVITFRREV
jgi:hypothetical protein